MTGRRADTSVSDNRASRRHFFKLLAGSPMLALAYPALSPSWQRSVSRELERSAAAGPRPAGCLSRLRTGDGVRQPAGMRSHAAQAPGAATQSPGAWTNI